MSEAFMLDNIAPNLQDQVGTNSLIRVYPYEMVNSKNSIGFIAPQTVSIITLSQDNMSEHQGMKQDNNGNWYYEALPDMSLVSKLDAATTTSTMTKILKEEVNFNLFSNTFYESGWERISKGNTYFTPSVFTIGAPIQYTFVNEPNYTPSWYKNINGVFSIVTDATKLKALSDGVDGEMRNAKFERTEKEEEAIYFFFNEAGQEIYISTTVKASKEYLDMVDANNKDGMYQINMANISALTSQYDNCVLKFSDADFSKNVDTITLGIESNTLLGSNFIKGKADIDTKYGLYKGIDIDFTTTEPMTPIKLTPVGDKDKITVYADWFDYDFIFPWAVVNKFRNITQAYVPTTSNTKEIQEKADPKNCELDKLYDINILSDKAIKLIKDMVLYTYMFDNNFADVPIIVDKASPSYGKIDGSYDIGFAKIKVVNLIGHTPIAIIDGLYETFIKKNPDYLENKAKSQALRSTISGLSRYINSNYCIAKGNNGFNSVYAPWYFKLNAIGAKIPTSGVKNISLIGGTTLSLRSIYFTKTFSNVEVNYPSNELNIPEKINCSKEFMVQTDRKLTIPEVGYQVDIINKLTNPGDIKSTSANDLKYLWWLPIKSLESLKNLYLQNLNGSTTANNKYFYTLPQSALNEYGGAGQIITLDQVQKLILNRNKGATIQIPPSIGYTDRHTLIIKTIKKDYDQNDAVEIIFANGYKKTCPLTDNDLVKYEPLKSIYEEKIKHQFMVVYAVIDKYLSTNELIETIKNTIKGFVSKSLGTNKNIALSNFELSTDEVKSIYNNYDNNDALSLNGSVDVSYKLLAVGEAYLIGVRKPVKYANRGLIYDKSTWKEFINKFQFTNSNIVEYEIKSKEKINKLHYLSFTSLFGSSVVLTLSKNKIHTSVIIPLFNNKDEKVATQKILFS